MALLRLFGARGLVVLRLLPKLVEPLVRVRAGLVLPAMFITNSKGFAHSKYLSAGFGPLHSPKHLVLGANDTEPNFQT